MSASVEPPARYEAVRRGSATLWVRADFREAWLRAGLDDPGKWDRLAATSEWGAGRGTIGRVQLDGASRFVLKKMRRGGLLAPLWRDRFLGVSRLVENLDLPDRVAARGIATARAVALLMKERPPRFYQAWIATEEIRGASDLVARFNSSKPPSLSEMRAVVSFVRTTHDAGLEHADLNLGNLLVRPVGGGRYDVFVVDLDRARLRSGPVPPAGRRAALRRLERSYLKCFGGKGPAGPAGPLSWVDLYCAGDETLSRELSAHSFAHGLRLAIHRLGWRWRKRRPTPEREHPRGRGSE